MNGLADIVFDGQKINAPDMAMRQLSDALHICYQIEEKWPSIYKQMNLDDELAEKIRGVMDQLTGWCSKEYHLFGFNNQAISRREVSKPIE